MSNVSITDLPTDTSVLATDLLLVRDTTNNVDKQATAKDVLTALAGSTSLVPKVQSYTNSGTAGGTGYYINLGGIKLAWGVTGALGLVSGTNNGNAQVNFPASFFAFVQTFVITPTGASDNGIEKWGISANTTPSTTGVSVYFYITTGNNAGSAVNCTGSWFAVGT